MILGVYAACKFCGDDAPKDTGAARKEVTDDERKAMLEQRLAKVNDALDAENP